MKLHRLLTLVLSSALLAVDAPAEKTVAAASADFSALPTADDFWKRIQKLQEQPAEQPKSRDEALQMAAEWLGRQQQAAEAFVRAYPQDPRRWQATMLGLRASSQLRRFSGQVPAPDEDRRKIAEIVNAPDAPPAIKGEAAFMGVMMFTAAFDPAQPESFGAFHRAAADFLEKYPEHELAGQLKQVQMRVLSEDFSSEAAALLQKIAAGADPRQAAAAKAILDRRQKMIDLKTRPVDIKFTSTDGREVDLADLRGKVVLLDFWASWCGPCIIEMPNLVSIHKKLHDKGFVIVGISLDQDKEAMEGALKKHEMTWVQHFDGTGWQNKFSTAFGITSLPAAWLIDKKGLPRATGLHGDALAAEVEKLLME